jgi:5-(carboxyamino)imidazole ribonucleotide synthase
VTAVRVGIIGGGQLGRMLAQAGQELGIACTTLDPAADSPAAQVGPTIVGAYDDDAALDRLAAASDVVTFEFENVPVAAVRSLEGRLPVYPPPLSLETGQDRLAEKTLFTEVGLPVPMFAAVEDLASLEAAVVAVGLPAVLKTRRLGYDGKGQTVIHRAELLEDAWRAVGEVPSICEAFVRFDREVSIIAARRRDGEVRCWPLVENHHREGILRLSLAPAPGAEALQEAAERHARAVLERLGHVGVLTIELFVQGETLLGNEMAPRVHNSGHWTIEGAETSQFENHLRAVCGLPLGSTAPRGWAAMLNLIGEEPDPASVLAFPDAHLHRYGKAPRAGRKVGHVTIRGDDEAVVRERMLQVSALLPIPQPWPI